VESFAMHMSIRQIVRTSLLAALLSPIAPQWGPTMSLRPESQTKPSLFMKLKSQKK
jgi:hypothetical protein